ncbi:uncharacterized protein EHS24_006954 [Apiotrichum porosum]|uniref:Citrate transporter-like domain-containing protein n=1 Tax=Apiotrichum porosum TaxID=105984 RepID=A0A427XWN2_9TREE|nr:uncharacterized protein EHS24_006954 [Apiotrichum porosum]RSH83279.1 hypothetical protein EHS24_006954 [Apiotrichum porosum]
MTHAIDARSVVALVVFFVVNALVIFPVHIPLPHALGRAVQSVKEAILGPADDEAAEPDEDDDESDMEEEEEEEAQTVVEQGPPVTPSPATEPSSAASTVTHLPRSPPAVKDDTDEATRTTHRPQSPQPRAQRTHFTLGLATAPVIGVLVPLASTAIPGSVVRGGIVGIAGVRPYDIMTLFLSFAYISLSLDRTGLLRYLAFTVAMRASTSGRKLFSSLYALFLLLSLVVGNDPVVLSGTPFVAYFTSHARVLSTPFVFMQFQAANLASALLVSSNPTNLVLTASFGLSFLSFSAWTALPTVAAGAVLYPSLLFIFRHKIPKTIRSPHVVPRSALLDPFGAVWTTTIFIATIALLVGLSAGGKLEGVEGVWTVTAPAAMLVLVRDVVYDLARTRPEATMEMAQRQPSQDGDVEQQGRSSTAQAEVTRLHAHPLVRLRRRLPTVSAIVARLPLPLLPFAFSMFILVNALEYTGWVAVWAHWWAAWARVGGVAGCVWLMGVVSVVGCNVFGTNIGVTVLLSRVLAVWNEEARPSKRALYGSVLSLAIGSNFGAYSFTFSASLAGLLWRDILAHKGLAVRAREFVRWNVAPLGVTMAVACLVVAGEVCVMFKGGESTMSQQASLSLRVLHVPNVPVKQKLLAAEIERRSTSSHPIPDPSRPA